MLTLKFNFKKKRDHWGKMRLYDEIVGFSSSYYYIKTKKTHDLSI